MVAHYIKIDKAPSFAPDAKAVVRIATGTLSYKYYYVDGKRDAKNLCAEIGLDLKYA